MKIRFIQDITASGQQNSEQTAPASFSRRFRAGEILTVTDVRQTVSQRRRHPSSIHWTLPGGQQVSLVVPVDSYEIITTYSEGPPQ